VRNEVMYWNGRWAQETTSGILSAKERPIAGIRFF
jgi:hypothetical protein